MPGYVTPVELLNDCICKRVIESTGLSDPLKTDSITHNSHGFSPSHEGEQYVLSPVPNLSLIPCPTP